MSAVRREFINLNVNGHHLKSVPDVNCVNGGVGGGGAQKEKRNWETIFLFSVILLQTICTVVGFIVFAYFVDQKFENERMIISSKIFFLNSEIELLKKNISMKQNRSMPRGGMMPPVSEFRFLSKGLYKWSLYFLSTFTYVHLHAFTFTYTHFHSFTFIYPRLHTFML